MSDDEEGASVACLGAVAVTVDSGSPRGDQLDECPPTVLVPASVLGASTGIAAEGEGVEEGEGGEEGEGVEGGEGAAEGHVSSGTPAGPSLGGRLSLRLASPPTKTSSGELTPASVGETSSGESAGESLPTPPGESSTLLALGWRQPRGEPSLNDMFSSIGSVSELAPWWRQLLSFIGPSWLIAVGYMDPGNWVGDITGGALYGYTLLFVVAFSSGIAMFLQSLAARLGLATGRDLAQACRDAFPRWVVVGLWLSAEAAIASTDLAEVIGSAIALKLLFGLPTAWGVVLTAVDVLVVLAFSSIPSITRGLTTRIMEIGVGLLVSFIAVSFFVLLGYSHPVGAEVMLGFVPNKLYFVDSGALLVAVSIVGATVMPHNLYLHSSLVQTRAAVAQASADAPPAARARLMRFLDIDSAIALLIAFVVNASILIVAGAAFHAGNSDVGTLEDAYHLLEPLLGQRAAPLLFGAALLAAGQIATLTGTLAGQIVMEGFLHWTLQPFIRRLLTRLLAIVPALVATLVGGDASLNTLLLVSQVVLSFQLPFAVFPLVLFTSDRAKMGSLVLSRVSSVIGWAVAAVIAVINVLLIVTSFT